MKINELEELLESEEPSFESIKKFLPNRFATIAETIRDINNIFLNYYHGDLAHAEMIYQTLQNMMLSARYLIRQILVDQSYWGRPNKQITIVLANGTELRYDL